MKQKIFAGVLAVVIYILFTMGRDSIIDALHTSKIEIWMYDVTQEKMVVTDEWKKGYVVMDKETGEWIEHYDVLYGHMWEWDNFYDGLYEGLWD